MAVLASQWQAMTPKWGSSQIRACNEVRPWNRVEVVKVVLEKEVRYRDDVSPLPVSIF